MRKFSGDSAEVIVDGNTTAHGKVSSDKTRQKKKILNFYVRGVIRKFAEKYCNFVTILYFSLKIRVNIVVINMHNKAKFQMRTLTILKVIVTMVTPPSQHRPSIILTSTSKYMYVKCVPLKRSIHSKYIHLNDITVPTLFKA